MNATEDLLRFSVQDDGTSITVFLSGELDMAGVPAVSDLLTSLERPYERLVLELSELTFIDSSGISVLVREQMRAQSEGHELAITGVGGEVRRVLELTGIWNPLMAGQVVTSGRLALEQDY